MRFLKRVLIAVMICLFFSANLLVAQSVPINQLIVPDKTSVIPFRWQGGTINAKWEPNAFMLVPVRIGNCPRTFYMQFDLGSPYSLFYKSKIGAIKTKYPKSVPSDVVDGKMKAFSFKAGSVPVFAREIVVIDFDGSGIDWKNKSKIEIIGTIGADLIDGKVAIIDYLRNDLTLSAEVPKTLQPHISLTDFVYSNRRVLLPSKINGKGALLYFDTGSSMFELLIDKETCLQLAIDTSKPAQYEVQSWGKILNANTFVSNENIELAGKKIPLRSVTYMDGADNSQIALMQKIGIGGMTGNKLFLNHVLILDTKNSKFGIKLYSDQQ